MDSRKNVVHKVNRDLSSADIAQVLLDNDWPQTPFYRTALKHKFAEKKWIPNDDLKRFRQLEELLDTPTAIEELE